MLAAARAAMTEYGSLAQIDDIACRAGVGVGTVYRHFPTKDALLGELVQQKFETFAANARAAVATDDPAALFALMEANAEVMAADAALRQIGTLDVPPPDSQALRDLIALTGELIARGKAAGVLRDDLEVSDIPLLMMGVCGSMEQGEHAWRRHFQLAVDALRAG